MLDENQQRSNMRSKEQLLWIAGLLEGEGSFELAKVGNYPRMRISCKMTDSDVIEKLRTTIGLGHIYKSKSTQLKIDGTPCLPQFIYRLYKMNQVYDLCKELFPFMGNRRQKQIQKLLLFYENKENSNA
jgi:hypothetical protein